MGLLIGGPEHLYTVLFGVVCILLETFISYARYAAVLKWATLSLFGYVAVVFAAHVPWGSPLASTLVPHLVFDAPHAMAIVAVLGTTISPYLFFWQAGQEIEELHRRHVKALCIAPRDAGPELSRIRTDTIVGMGISNLIALCIMSGQPRSDLSGRLYLPSLEVRQERSEPCSSASTAPPRSARTIPSKRSASCIHN